MLGIGINFELSRGAPISLLSIKIFGGFSLAAVDDLHQGIPFPAAFSLTYILF